MQLAEQFLEGKLLLRWGQIWKRKGGQHCARIDTHAQERPQTQKPDSAKPSTQPKEKPLSAKQQKAKDEADDAAKIDRARSIESHLHWHEVDLAMKAFKTSQDALTVARNTYILGWVVAGIAAGQFLMFGIQLLRMREANRTAAQAAKAAQDAGKAAGDEIVHAKETATRQLRPYIGIRKLFFTNSMVKRADNTIGPAHYRDALKLKIKNFGKTPGYIVSVRIGREKLPPDGTPTPLYFVPNLEQLIYEAPMIYPSQTITVDVPEKSGFGENDIGFIVYGRIDYKDRLGKMDESYMFCFKYLGANKFIRHGPYNNETEISTDPRE